MLLQLLIRDRFEPGVTPEWPLVRNDDLDLVTEEQPVYDVIRRKSDSECIVRDCCRQLVLGCCSA